MASVWVTWCPRGAVCRRGNSRLCKKDTKEEAEEYLRNHLQGKLHTEHDNLTKEDIEHYVETANYEIWEQEEWVEDPAEMPHGDSDGDGGDQEVERRRGEEPSRKRSAPNTPPGGGRANPKWGRTRRPTQPAHAPGSSSGIPPPPPGPPPSTFNTGEMAAAVAAGVQQALAGERAGGGGAGGVLALPTPAVLGPASSGMRLQLAGPKPKSARALVLEAAETASRASIAARSIAEIAQRSSRAFEFEAQKLEEAQTVLTRLSSLFPDE